MDYREIIMVSYAGLLPVGLGLLLYALSKQDNGQLIDGVVWLGAAALVMGVVWPALGLWLAYRHGHITAMGWVSHPVPIDHVVAVVLLGAVMFWYTRWRHRSPPWAWLPVVVVAALGVFALIAPLI